MRDLAVRRDAPRYDDSLPRQVRFDVMHQGATKKDKAFTLWVHTSFLSNGGQQEFGKEDLDKAFKDKKHSLFPHDFRVTLHYELLPSAPNQRASQRSSGWTDKRPHSRSPPRSGSPPRSRSPPRSGAR